MGRDSKYCNKNTISIENLRKKVSPVSLEDYFILRYYKDNVNCECIGLELGISGSSVRRIMKELGINLRNKEQCVKRLHNYTRGRKWTNEKAKENVSKGVKSSYDEIDGLREQRSKDNVKVWSSMSENEKKNRYMPGLVTMHASKRTKKRKVK